MEIWNGFRAGVDGAVEDYDADEAYVIDLLDEEIIEKLLNKERLYYRIGHDAEFDARVSQWIKKQMPSTDMKTLPLNCYSSTVLLMKCV